MIDLVDQPALIVRPPGDHFSQSGIGRCSGDAAVDDFTCLVSHTDFRTMNYNRSIRQVLGVNISLSIVVAVGMIGTNVNAYPPFSVQL